MMTINRTTLNETAKNVIMERKTKRFARLEKIIEKRVLPELVKFAESGYFTYTAHFYDCGINEVEFIKENLESIYKLTVCKKASSDYELVISWN